MGKLRNIFGEFSLSGIKHFVETGTGRGESLKFMHHVTEGKLDTYCTVEIWPALWEAARQNFPWANCYSGHSPQALEAILPCIPEDEPIIFWLDAHFPGADFGLAERKKDHDDAENWPLAKELEVINRLRPARKDIILIDDYRMVEDFKVPKMKQLFPNWVYPGPGFIDELFGETHNRKIISQMQYYLVLTPK